MRVLVVSGIWPPDVGGPASHAPEVAAGLAARGHAVEVVTTASASPPAAPFPVHAVSRRLPPGVRHLAVSVLVARRARRAEVVYATSMVGRTALGASLARRPLVVKLAGDAAFERARRLGLFAGELDGFQRTRGGARMRALRLARDLALRRAAHVVCPSAYLARLATGWGVDERRVSVVPNPAPRLPPLPERAAARARLGVAGPALVLAGRLNAQKSVAVALEAVAAVEGVSLLVAGEGEERAGLERRAEELGLDGRVRFLGAVPRERVLELFRAADAVLLSSSWENFPHVLVEALAVGTPVIATRVGGVGEIVVEGENGLLAPAGDAGELAAVVRRFLRDGELRERLRAGAAPSAARFDSDRLLDRLERILIDAAVARR